MYNLYLRLEKHEMSVLRFLTEEARAIGLPSTNNRSEQAIKPHKVHQRRSGCFRSKEAAEQYLVVQAYLRSSVAHEPAPLEAIKLALAGKPWLPEI